jgi:hypothetical protein
MGAVMSYAVTLAKDRRLAPAGVLAFSGFIPAVEVVEGAWPPGPG